MILLLKPDANEAAVTALRAQLEQGGITVQELSGSQAQALVLLGDVSRLPEERLLAYPIVAEVKHLSHPCCKADRRSHPQDTVVKVGNVQIGGGHFAVIAGPCSVESPEQLDAVASAVRQAGASLLRGGAFKPRTSPYSFQGLRADGLELLQKARARWGLPIVSEVMSSVHLPLFADVDVIQVGARNMQNFELLKKLGQQTRPVLLKRGLSATLEELVMSAEYILARGNPNVILCERGIRTFEPSTRSTLDLSAVPVLHRMTHLPVIVDPSHATGAAWMVPSLAKAALAAGADGLMIEVHNAPEQALSDGAQSLTSQQFAQLMDELRPLAQCLGRTLNG